MKAAYALWQYAERSANYIFGKSLGNPLAETIYFELKSSPQGLTLSEISSRLGHHASKEEINAALQLLKKMGLIQFFTVKTAGRSAVLCKATEKEAKFEKEKVTRKEEVLSTIEDLKPAEQKKTLTFRIKRKTKLPDNGNGESAAKGRARK